MDFFTLAAGPNTDLWRKPPDRDTATAPVLYTSLRQPFAVAEVTVTADWEMEWDQGGLVIFAGAPPRQPQQQHGDNVNRTSGGPNTNDTITITSMTSEQQTEDDPPPPYPHPLPSNGTKWVKAGLEFSAGAVNASSVSATADGADWCLAPLAPPHTPIAGPPGSSPTSASLRIKLERIGHSLWVWYQVPSAERTDARVRSPNEISSSWRKLREVTWFFWDVDDKSVHVGVYSSRPADFSPRDTVWAAREGTRSAGGMDVGVEGSRLEVEFEDLEIF